MIWGQGKVSQDAQQRKDSTICNAMYNAICSQKTELCFADAAICYSAHVATLDPVQLHSRLMLIMPGSLHWTIRLTAFSWTDGAKHHNNVFVVSCRDLRLRKIISRERIVKKREMLIVDQFQRQGHLQKKSRKTVRLLKIEQRITRIPLLQDNSMQFEWEGRVFFFVTHYHSYANYTY